MKKKQVSLSIEIKTEGYLLFNVVIERRWFIYSVVILIAYFVHHFDDVKVMSRAYASLIGKTSLTEKFN